MAVNSKMADRVVLSSWKMLVTTFLGTIRVWPSETGYPSRNAIACSHSMRILWESTGWKGDSFGRGNLGFLLSLSIGTQKAYQAPFEGVFFRAVSRVSGQEDGPALQAQKVSLSFDSVVEAPGDVPSVIGGRGDQKPVHGPVVVLAQGHSVSRVVVVGFAERDQVGGVHDRDAAGQDDAQSAGCASVVVYVAHDPGKGRVPDLVGYFRGPLF